MSSIEDVPESSELNSVHYENVAVFAEGSSDHHEDTPRTSDLHEEVATSSDHHEEMATTSDHHMEVATTSDHHEEMATTSDHHVVMATASDHHVVMATTSDHHEEIASTSDEKLQRSSSEGTPPPGYRISTAISSMVPEEKPNDHLELATCACILNFFIGIVALRMSLKSMDAYRRGDFQKAKKSSRNAFICSMLALFSLFALACIIIYVVTREYYTREEIMVMDMNTTMVER